MLFYNAGGNWYSVRLYRSPIHEGIMSAVFCICPCDEIYIKVKINCYYDSSIAYSFLCSTVIAS